MSNSPQQWLQAFTGGFIATLLFHQGVLALFWLAGLIPAATELANLLAESIHDLDEDTIEWVINEIRGHLGAGEKEGPTH